MSGGAFGAEVAVVESWLVVWIGSQAHVVRERERRVGINKSVREQQ